MIHYHGTPITPNAELLKLSGRHFCTSFARPDQVKTVHEIGQGNMLDNGAFSAWRRGIEIDWRKWAAWAEPWLDYKTSWAILPDTVDAGEAENDRLLREYGSALGPQGTPVWHLDEPISRLLRLADGWDRIAFGSSGQYGSPRSAAWHARVSEAFDALADAHGRIPVWVHMLRGMALAGGPYPFASVDSTDIGRNHNRPGNDVVSMASRWDAMQQPARWEPLSKEVAA